MSKPASYRVLVADDDELILKLVEYKLTEEGIAVTAVADGDQAIESLNAERPDLVILDSMMPGRDGIFVLQQIKENEETKEIPVVLLTARSRQDDIIGGLSMGADEYIVKPFIPEELVVRVMRLLKASAKK